VSTVDPTDALTRRIEELAAFDDADAAAAPPSLDVSALRVEVAGVRADLGSLRAEMGAVRADLDGLGGRLTGSVAASRAETGTLVRRMTELATRLESVGGRVDEVRTGMPTLAREVREGLDQVPSRTSERLEELSAGMSDSVGRQFEDLAADVRRTLTSALEQDAGAAAGTQAALADTRGAIEARLAVLEDCLDGMAERIEALARDGAGRTTEKLVEVETRVRSVAGRLDEVADQVVNRLQEQTEQRLTALTAQLTAHSDELRRDLTAGLEQAAAQNAAVTASVNTLADSVRTALEGFSTTVDAGISGLGSSVTAALTEGREESRAGLDAVVDTLFKTVTAQQDQLLGRTEVQSMQLTALQHAVEDRVEGVRTQMTKAAADLRADVMAEIGAVRPQVEELAAASTSTGESFRGLRVDLADALEALRVRLGQSSTESTEAVRTALTELRGEVESLTRGVREGVLDRLEERFGALSSRLAEVSGTVTGSANAARETQERVASLAAASDEVRRAVEAIRTQRGQRPAAATPSKADTAKAELAKAEPAKADGAKAEPAKAEPAKAELAKAEPAKAELAKAEPAKAEPAKAEPAKAEQAKAEPAKAEPAKAEPAKAEPAKAEASAPVPPEPAKAEPAKAAAAKAVPKAVPKPLPKARAKPAKKAKPTKPTKTTKPAAKAPAKAAEPAKASPPQPGAAAPAKAVPQPAAARSTLPPTAQRTSQRPADRRGRLDEMPEVPSVQVALDAAVDAPERASALQSRLAAIQTRTATPAPAPAKSAPDRPQPTGAPAARPPAPAKPQPAPLPQREGTSWAARPEPPDDEPEREGMRLFRRRKK